MKTNILSIFFFLQIEGACVNMRVCIQLNIWKSGNNFLNLVLKAGSLSAYSSVASPRVSIPPFSFLAVEMLELQMHLVLVV